MQEFAWIVVSFGVAVVDPGLAHISGESGLPIADVLNATNRVSGTAAANDRILIRFSSERPSRPGKTHVPKIPWTDKIGTESVPVVSPINTCLSRWMSPLWSTKYVFFKGVCGSNLGVT